jgi:cytochrome c-type biogenesis protein CcmH
MRHPLIPVLVLAVASILACREKPRPAEQAPAAEATAPPGLTPLTSRGAGSAEAPAADSPHGDMGSPHGDMPPGHPPVSGSGASPHGSAAADAASGHITGTIEVAPARKADVKGGALFVIARNATSHQVVAVRREETGPFPFKFELTGADVMMAGVAFEGPFDVTARWSQQGDAMPAPGDIEGVAKGVAIDTANVKIVLSDVRK